MNQEEKSMTVERLLYAHEGTELEAYVAKPVGNQSVRGTLLLLHAWEGRAEFICKRAEHYAQKGFLAVALDQYGRGVVGRSPEENTRLMTPLMHDRPFLGERLKAGYRAVLPLAAQLATDNRVFAMGYCFGGLCALDLLRTGLMLKGVISVHGLFAKPEGITCRYYQGTKVLALTGYRDPMVPVDQVLALEKELSEARLDWQVVNYGQAMHAFTNPHAHEPERGLDYHALSERRAYEQIDQFLNEV